MFDKLNELYYNIRDFFRDTIPDIFWQKYPAILECDLCRNRIAPYLLNKRPYDSYGWIKVKRHGFICHSCYYHSYSEKERDKLSKQARKEVSEEFAYFKTYYAPNAKLITKSYGYKIINIPFKTRIKMLTRKETTLYE